MNRRDAMVSSSIGLGVLLLGRRALGDAPGKGDKPLGGGAPMALLTALSDCQRSGELCVAHCAGELAKGNKEMGRCNLKVHEMLALTHAMTTLVSLESPAAKQLASLCAAACQACKEACAEHKAHFAHGMHLACKDCMDACEKCEAACRQYAT